MINRIIPLNNGQINSKYVLCPFHNKDADSISGYSGGTCNLGCPPSPYSSHDHIEVWFFRNVCCASWTYDDLLYRPIEWYGRCPLFKENWDALDRRANETGCLELSPTYLNRGKGSL